MSTTYIVAAYDVALAFGGPEEGGWWYMRGELVRVLRIAKNEEEAHAYCRRVNAKLLSREFGPNKGRPRIHHSNGTSEIQATTYEDFAPASFPEKKPHYE